MPYQVLVKGTVGLGAFMTLYGLGSAVFGYEVAYFYQQWWLMIGALVVMAGILAALSLQSITFDLKERFYRRRQGPGFLPRGTHGSLNDLDAVVLLAEPNSRMITGGVTYHLVLHWKNNKEPLMVLQQDTRQVAPGQPLNYAATQLLNQGMAYARALNLPFYDNSHFPSKCPVTVWQA